MKPVQLGNTLTDEDLDRDAIHIAVYKAEAGEELWSGTHVRLNKAGVAKECRDTDKSIGIVDPFLEMNVKKGAKFYILLKPYTITGLSHLWTHPGVPDVEVQMVGGSGARADGSNLGLTKEQAEAEVWLEEFGEEIGLPAEDLIQVLSNANSDKGFFHTFNHDTPEDCWDKRKKMWESWEIITQSKARDADSVPFSCAC